MSPVVNSLSPPDLPDKDTDGVVALDVAKGATAGVTATCSRHGVKSWSFEVKEQKQQLACCCEAVTGIVTVSIGVLALVTNVLLHTSAAAPARGERPGRGDARGEMPGTGECARGEWPP